MSSTKSEYFLVTLNELEFPSTTLSSNDLFYILQYDARSSTYKSDANKITLDTLNEFIKGNNGTSILYDAGLNANEVLLIPESGIVPGTILPAASGITPGIVGEAPGNSNIQCSEGVIELNSTIDIEAIQTDGTFTISSGSVIINGETWKGNYKTNSIITVTDDTIVLDRNNGDNPYYLLNPSTANTVFFDTANITSLDEKVYTFKVILISDQGDREISWNTNPTWTTSIKNNKKYIISIDVLPASVLGEVTMVPSIVSIV